MNKLLRKMLSRSEVRSVLGKPYEEVRRGCEHGLFDAEDLARALGITPEEFGRHTRLFPVADPYGCPDVCPEGRFIMPGDIQPLLLLLPLPRPQRRAWRPWFDGWTARLAEAAIAHCAPTVPTGHGVLAGLGLCAVAYGAGGYPEFPEEQAAVEELAARLPSLGAEELGFGTPRRGLGWAMLVRPTPEAGESWDRRMARVRELEPRQGALVQELFPVGGGEDAEAAEGAGS